MKPSYLMELFCYFTFLGYRETFLDLKRLFWGFGVGQTNCQIKMNIGQTICRTKIKIDGYVDRARAGSLGLKIRNWHFFLKNLICTYLKIQIYWMLLSSNHHTGLYTSMLQLLLVLFHLLQNKGHRDYSQGFVYVQYSNSFFHCHTKQHLTQNLGQSDLT